MNNPLTCYSGEERSIRNGRIDNTVLRHENVRGCEFRNIAKHVADYSVIETPRMCVEESASIIRIKAPCLGIHGHGLECWPAIGRERDGKSFWRAHRRLIYAEAPAGGFRIVGLDPW